MNDALRFNTGEVELAYSEWPGEGPPVVALHGISLRRSANLTRCEDGHHAFAYDHRGHGESARAPGTYTLVNYGRDAIAFLREVVREPAILIGHSMGGLCAAYAAANAPELVKAAFLVEMPIFWNEREPNALMAVIEQRAGLPLDEQLSLGTPPAFAGHWAQLDPNTMKMVNDGTAFAGWDTVACLRAIDCPVVLEHGDREGIPEGDIPSALAEGDLERAQPLLKNVRVLHMPGTGHVPWFGAEAAFYAELSAFITEQRKS